METSTPVTVGRLVLYKLSEQDVEAINANRKTDECFGGNSPQVGDLLPTIVVKVWENNMFNGQVFLDGNDTLWVTSVVQGSEPGQWDWMPFQKDQQARLAKQEEKESAE